MSISRIIALGASAGGVEPLIKIARALPRDLPAAMCIVLHVPPHSPSMLPALINRGSGLEASHAKDGEEIRHGRIYIAPPDCHLLVRFGRVRLGKGPSENGSRPAIDPLFRSIAREFGRSGIGVVLSGGLDDGTAGLYAIKAAGGIAVVQDPEEALYPSMPRNAVQNVVIDHVVPSADIPALLERLVAAAAGPTSVEPAAHAQEAFMEIDVAHQGVSQEQAEGSPGPGEPSGFACPDCHGVLWQIKDGELTRFRCRVGHAYLPESLAAAQSVRLEEALWIAMRTLRESAALATRLAARAEVRSMLTMASMHRTRADEARERARVIEAVLKRGKLITEDQP